MSDQPTAFLVMAISDEPAVMDVHRAISRACVASGVEPKRVDEIPHFSKITDVIVDEIISADLIIADLSLERPNVYYEVGFAHGIQKTVLLICRAGEKMHFDLAGHNCLFYTGVSDLEDKLRERVTSWGVTRAKEHDQNKTLIKERLRELPSFLVRQSLDELRASMKTAMLSDIDNSTANYSPGTYGYLTPWSIKPAFQIFVEGKELEKRHRLETNPGGTVSVELHYTEAQMNYLVAFIRDADEHVIHATENQSSREIIVKFKKSELYTIPVGIPLARVISIAHRSTPKLGEIADLTIV